MIQSFEAIRRLKAVRDDLISIAFIFGQMDVELEYIDCSIETINETIKVIRDGNENFGSRKR